MDWTSRQRMEVSALFLALCSVFVGFAAPQISAFIQLGRVILPSAVAP
jgi:hypothetical protein